MIFRALLISTMAAAYSFAFQQNLRNFCSYRTHLSVQSESNENHPLKMSSSPTSRRGILQDAGAAMAILLIETATTQPAEASYSAYTHREEDWKAREEKGGEI